MPASRLLQHYWRDLDDSGLAATLEVARAGIAAFAGATSESGSLIQSWVRGKTMLEFEHYPTDDVVDTRSGSQFYYHAHRSHGTEHGHLHLFWHATASGRRRHVASLSPRWGRTAPSHLLAIGLDNRGLPVSLFTVNQWVTDGHWFDAATTQSMVERFAVRGATGHETSAVWLTNFVRLYRPLIAELLQRRDRRLGDLETSRSALQDRRLEVLSHRDIDWGADLAVLELLHQRRLRKK